MTTTIDAGIDRLREGINSGTLCRRCGTGGGAMQPTATPDNPRSSHVFDHVDATRCKPIRSQLFALRDEVDAFKRRVAALELAGDR